MKTIVVAALLALSFTTGFTCSKNTPAPEAAPVVETTTVITPPADGTGTPDATPTPAPTEAAPAPSTDH